MISRLAQRMLEEAGTTDYRKTNRCLKRLESSRQVADEVRPAVAIYASRRAVVSVIEVFLTGTGHAKR